MLTKRQKQVFDFITSYRKKRGYSPSLEDIRKHFKLASVSTAHFHVKKLQELGLLEKQYNKPRSIALYENEAMVNIPLLGLIAAGQPIEAIQNKETIAVPQNKLPRSPERQREGKKRDCPLRTGEFYALRVIGNSMVDENINDGDIILVKQQNIAENGQKIVALIDNYEATLKKFYKERGYIRLQPANKTIEPIIIKKDKELTIQGIVIDVIKNEEELQAEKILTAEETPRKKNDIKPYYQKPGFVLYQADALQLLNELPENSVDMVFADPPYLLSNGGFTCHAGKRVSVNKGEWDVSSGLKKDFEFHLAWTKACRRVLKPTGTIWISGTYHSIYQCGFALQVNKFHILNDVVWFKPNAAPNLSCRYFTASHESLIWARKEKSAKHIFNYNLMKNGNWQEDFIKKPNLQMRSVWAVYPPKKPEKKFGKHPTQKPIELLKRIILASTKPKAVILDPFTGSSTTGIVAFSLGRKFIGIDIETKYLELSIKRFQDLLRGSADSKTSV